MKKSYKKSSKKSAKNKVSTYDNYCMKLADKIYNLIKGDKLKWKKGWAVNTCKPVNVGTGHVYSGGNSFCMALDCAIFGNRPFFIGQKELNTILGLAIPAKGEKYAEGADKFIKTKFIKNRSWMLAPQFVNDLDDNKKVILDKRGNPIKRLAYFKTFPACNVDEVLEAYPQHKEVMEAYLLDKGYTHEANEEGNDKDLYVEHKGKLTTILDTLNCSFEEKGSRAFFRPSTPEVVMPLYESFFEGDEWVGTFAHEVGHATALDKSIAKNENRGGNRFGDKDYAFEELVAEFFSILYCNEFNVGQSQNNSVAYLQSWMNALDDLYETNKKAFYQAVLIAQKNFDKSMLVLTPVEENEKELV